MSDTPEEIQHPWTKAVSRFIVAIGTGRITYAVIRNNMREDAENDKRIDKIAVPAASLVVGGMAVEATQPATDRMVDEFYEGLAKVRGFLKKDKNAKK